MFEREEGVKEERGKRIRGGLELRRLQH